MAMEDERRRYPRGRPREEMLAIFAPTPTLAQVKDLSLGGLCLEYITGPRLEKDWLQVNLFLTKSKAYLPALPFRLIYDRQDQDRRQSNRFLIRRVCGLEFTGLSSLQAAQLESILMRH
jgi:hypothetical protein